MVFGGGDKTKPKPERNHDQELKRRTYVIRIFPNEASCLRLIRALASETDDEWLDGACYLNMEVLREQNKTHLPLAA